MKSSLVYLSAPYSHKDPSVRESRFRLINEAASVLILEGLHIFSPISHSHSIEMAGMLPTDFAFWSSFDTAMLSVCGAMIVFQLPGWEESVGVKGEMDIACRLGLPVFSVRLGLAELREVAHTVLRTLKPEETDDRS
jgi:hypothetical protein